MNPSYSFDRAADFYDATRAYPQDIADKITQSILDLACATPTTRIFELGIGTGRIAAPLIARRLDLSGLDLSREMMTRLRAKFAAGAPLQLVQGDASALPFRDATFDAVLAVHVFHVIAPWRQAIAELRRVLRPDGLALHSTHIRTPHSPNAILRDKWHELIEAWGENWQRPGARDGRQSVASEFRSLGASVQEIEAARWTDSTTLQKEIQGLLNRTSSDTWAVSEPVLQATVAELTEWARDRFGALDALLEEENVFVWQVMRFDRVPLLPEPIRVGLIRLAPILNLTGSPWVLGGSCSLALHGVKVEPHDLDIATDRDGAYHIGESLRAVGEEERPVYWSEGEWIRSHYGRYRIGSVQVDVIGAAELRDGEGWIPDKPPAEWQTDSVTIPGADLSVAVFALEHELVSYRRMHRENKVRLIEERLQDQAIGQCAGITCNHTVRRAGTISPANG